MSQAWSYTDTFHSRCMSQTCLILTYISRSMHVLDTSYIVTRLNVDAMSQTWSYTGSHNVVDACPRHVLH
ncbi:hypothetical protein F383_31067 [Gossypium arboreum]|uniref:Uncharacterized protein n=1 Tax=Gossypium arboreum TaxID=29729 RepID=A0A0B0PJ33_GOSAR|nr:hypothetical protein F383_31067 [Gossypium arboreum]